MKRQTYAAVNRPEHQIKSFTEESGNGSSAPTISSSSFSVKDSSSPTVFVGVIPTASENSDEQDPFDVLAVHKDGRVRRLSPDLETQRWSLRHSEIAKTGPTHEINTCFLVEFEEAKKSLFKRRQDLAALALGNLTDAGVDEPSILLLVSHPVNTERTSLKDVKIHMFSVPANAPSSGLALDESQRMRHLLTANMPEVEGQEFATESLQWDFHSGSAGLSLSFERGFINFDLSQYSPTVSSQFILQDEQFSSVMRISPQSVIGAGKSIVALYDTQYQSVQRSIPVSDIPSSGSGTAFVGYFAKLGIAVAMKGSTLFAFELSPSNTVGPSLKRPRDGLLIDAIGRGISSDAQWETASKKQCTEEHMASLGLTSEDQVEKRNQLTVELEKCTDSKDADAFDSAVHAYFGTKLPASTQVHPELPMFLLSKIFFLKESGNEDKLSSASSFQLSINLWPKHICNWLIQMGHLCMSNVEIALRRSFKPRILPSLPTRSFVQALIDSDPSLRHLNQVLQGPVLMDADELAYALKTFLNMMQSSAGTLEEPSQPKALTAATTTTTLGQQSSPTLPQIYRGLNTTLRSLHHHPQPTISTSLRSALPKQSLISIIHHLRLSLATGGHTSRFTENPPIPISPYQINPSLPLSTITDILSASVDAIGPSGWISAYSSDGDLAAEADLIADLKSEISAALAGVEEATYLRGVLGEYITFAESVASSSSSGEKKKSRPSASVPSPPPTSTTANGEEHPLIRRENLNGAHLFVYPNNNNDGDITADPDSTGKLLPLSLKAPTADVSRTKVKKSTGEVKTRSSREIGHLRRKQGGKYSFERLVL